MRILYQNALYSSLQAFALHLYNSIHKGLQDIFQNRTCFEFSHPSIHKNPLILGIKIQNVSCHISADILIEARLPKIASNPHIKEVACPNTI